jgi:hypothetical protein
MPGALPMPLLPLPVPPAPEPTLLPWGGTVVTTGGVVVGTTGSVAATALGGKDGALLVPVPGTLEPNFHNSVLPGLGASDMAPSGLTDQLDWPELAIQKAQ